jgi:hypothetical protein
MAANAPEKYPAETSPQDKSLDGMAELYRCPQEGCASSMMQVLRSEAHSAGHKLFVYCAECLTRREPIVQNDLKDSVDAEQAASRGVVELAYKALVEENKEEFEAFGQLLEKALMQDLIGPDDFASRQYEG